MRKVIREFSQLSLLINAIFSAWGPCPFAWDFQETVGLREGWNRQGQEMALYSVQVDCHGVGGGDGVLARRDVQCVVL